MNLGQNKFFIGFGAVLLLGGIILGILLIQAVSTYNDADTKYTAQVDQLQRLQNLPLYPEPANLKIVEEQKQTAHEMAITLYQQLVPMAFPLEPMTPEQFQDKLNTSVKNLVEKADKMGVKLADKFYLGFGEYRSATPRPEAAAVLGRQLKCIELAVDTLIEKKVASIGEITRPHLAEEFDPRLSLEAPLPKPAANKGATPELVSKYPFEIQIIAEQKSFQAVLNDLSKNEKQFLIVRPLTIHNQSEKAPKKNDPNADRTNEIASSGSGGAAGKQEKMRYILGAEKLNVTLHFDSVVFAGNLPK